MHAATPSTVFRYRDYLQVMPWLSLLGYGLLIVFLWHLVWLAVAARMATAVRTHGAGRAADIGRGKRSGVFPALPGALPFCARAWRFLAASRAGDLATGTTGVGAAGARHVARMFQLGAAPAPSGAAHWNRARISRTRIVWHGSLLRTAGLVRRNAARRDDR